MPLIFYKENHLTFMGFHKQGLFCLPNPVGRVRGELYIPCSPAVLFQNAVGFLVECTTTGTVI